MNTRSLIATLSVCATALAISVVMSDAGPLSPPAGPIAPTNKTLDEVEPRIAVNATNTPGDADSLFKITQPGSYYLTGNIAGAEGKFGIEIAAPNVTLDLSGFALIGAAGSLDGVFVSGIVTGVAVENGVVSQWSGDGVDMTAASRSTLRLVRAASNGGSGLRIGSSSVVEACVANGNVSTGIAANAFCTIANSTASGNTTGITAGVSCSIANSTADSNGGDGIVTSTGAVVVACTARANGLTGISASTGSHVSQSTAQNNSGNGFSIGVGGVISGCSANNNSGAGVFAFSSVTIVDNVAAFNTGDGIQANNDSLVRGNACDSNGLSTGDGAGIHIASVDTRVEGNTVTRNDRGIDVDASGNIIIRNSASANGVNYDIVANNKVGVIVAAPDSLAIVGSTGGAGVGSTDPWANFSF